MATVAQLVEAVAAVTMIEKKTVNAYARSLIDAGSLPLSKGRAIAHVTPEHCSTLLIVMSLQPLIKAAASLVKIYNRLEAKTKSGTVVVKDCMFDLFGAASSGGATIEKDWKGVQVRIYENRLGVDLILPKNVGLLEFRLPAHMDLSSLDKIKIEPNRFFSRSATVSFSAFVFILEIAGARNHYGITDEGKECVKRIEALLPA